MNKNLELVREKVIGAVPEIASLVAPSELPLPIRYDSMGQYFWGPNDEMVAMLRGWGRIQYEDDAETKQDEVGKYVASIVNLGRPIRLADVLLAIQAEEARRNEDIEKRLKELGGTPVVKYPLFYQVMMIITRRQMDGKDFWNLRADSLESQSEETINFLADLLK